MPVFNLRATENDVSIQLDGGSDDTKGFLKPEELGRAIVSEGMDFDLAGLQKNGPWPKFCSSLKRLVVQAEQPQSFGLALEELSGKEQYRLILCSDVPIHPDPFQDWTKLLTFDMKIKLVSNVPLNASRQQREQGCLVQMTRICGGPENIKLRIKGVGCSRAIFFPWIKAPFLKLLWNQEDLCWETETATQVTFRNNLLSRFVYRNSTDLFQTIVTSISVEVGDFGMNNVLRRIYTGPGDNWKLQKQLLEQETFSDLVVVSDNPKNGSPKLFHCHRMKLTEVSQVFGDMLQGNWEEAQSRTIKLPESEDAIEAMLHFIYYGGTSRIYKTGHDHLLELLEMGHKYDIANLVDVAAFSLRCGDHGFSVETALQIFCFARNLDGQLWQELRKESITPVLISKKEERNQSESWDNLCRIAKRLGSEFHVIVNDLVDLGGYKRSRLPVGIKKMATKEDVQLIYDFVMAYAPLELANVGTVLGLFILAERLGHKFQQAWESIEKKMFNGKMVDYLVELFCLAKDKEGEFWMELKMRTVRSLSWYQTNQQSRLNACYKYKKRIRDDEVVAKEFESLKAALELEKEEEMGPGSIKRRRLDIM